MSSVLPLVSPAAFPPAHPERLPPWLRRQLPAGGGNVFTDAVIADLRLNTVCESARCPNRWECWSQKTATFMILGNTCTRPCGFCAVPRGKPLPPEADEPERLAEAAARLGLRHVVITSVTRDDLPDGGAEHYFSCIQAVRRRTGATIEVLTPDFIHCRHLLGRVVAAEPEVFNHNLETVPRLYARVRGPKSEYRWSLELLRQVKRLNPRVKTKSGLMLGLGETLAEVVECLAHLRAAGCDFLTLGQYLRPGEGYLPVVRYLPPEEFQRLKGLAHSLGFAHVASGPFVRSSYHAREMISAPETGPAAGPNFPPLSAQSAQA